MAAFAKLLGLLSTVVAFRDDGDPRPFSVDNSGNLRVVTTAGGSGDAITDDDDDTKIEVERTADDDHTWFKNAGVDTATIHESGIIDWLKQSGAKAYPNSPAQSIAPSTYTLVEWDAEKFDIQGEMNLDTERFVATETGLYLVTVLATILALDDQESFIVQGRRNGSGIGLARVYASVNDSNPAVSFATVIQMSANDYLELWVWHNHASILGLQYAATNTHMAAVKIA